MRFKDGDEVLLIKPKYLNHEHPQGVDGLVGFIVGRRGQVNEALFPSHSNCWVVEIRQAGLPGPKRRVWVDDDEGIQPYGVTEDEVTEAIQSIIGGST